MKVSPLEGHRLWAPSYDADLNPLVALEHRALAPLLDALRGQAFLDVACGTGRWLEATPGVGIDLCREMLLRAQSKPEVAGRVAQADMRRLPFRDRCTDVALCAFSLAYVEPLERVMVELARVIRPGGQLIASDLHPEGYRRGWTRSFRSGPEVYEIEHHPYSAAEWMAAARGAGLQLEQLLEPCFGEPERPIFRAAGREPAWDEVAGVPAVLIARWRR
ncbi:MAG: methyltransferase domain-containing protein [Acidobacteria bacterium]|nr:methyltransferase domain-containing protein [Acidobacteriota bacterium]